MSSITGTPCEPLGSASYLQTLGKERREADKQLEATDEKSDELARGDGAEPVFHPDRLAAVAVIAPAQESEFSGFQNPHQHKNPFIQAYANTRRQTSVDASHQPGHIFDGYV